jgi:hypothetical protein
VEIQVGLDSAFLQKENATFIVVAPVLLVERQGLTVDSPNMNVGGNYESGT